MSNQTATHFLYGYVFYNSAPSRNEDGKWFVPESAFNGSVYPEYVNGNFYIMSRNTFSTIVNDEKMKQVNVSGFQLG